MYEFLDRLMSIAIPRIRDFRGLNPRSFDGRGNYSMGIREQIIFPEIDYDAIDQVRGLDITITTTAQTDEEAFALLEAFGMPFSRRAARAATPTPRPRPRTSAARGGARQAEAEQAALEQLKEENPEAYEKPAPQPRAKARSGADETARGARWPRPHRACASSAPKYKTRNYTRCRRCGRRARSSASSASAGSACASSPTRATSPG